MARTKASAKRKRSAPAAAVGDANTTRQKLRHAAETGKSPITLEEVCLLLHWEIADMLVDGIHGPDKLEMLYRQVMNMCVLEREAVLYHTLVDALGWHQLRIPRPGDVGYPRAMALSWTHSRQQEQTMLMTFMLCNTRGFGVGVRFEPRLLSYLVNEFIWPTLMADCQRELAPRVTAVLHVFGYLGRYWLQNAIIMGRRVTFRPQKPFNAPVDMPVCRLDELWGQVSALTNEVRRVVLPGDDER